MLDSPVSTERIARLGYDYVCIDAQHGLIEYAGILRGLTAIDAGGSSVGLVRVGANEPFHIGQALDAGAAGIIVPLVNTADDAARAVAAVSVRTGRCDRCCGSDRSLPRRTRPSPYSR